MNKIIIICMGPETSASIRMQLTALIGDKVEVQSYCISEDIPKVFKDCLIVFTGHGAKNLFLSKLHPNTDYIVARRVINYEHLEELISLPNGSEVLLINDNKTSCLTAIEQLKKLGIDHVKYSPYYPGIEEYKKLELAITPGESNLAPACVKKIIDIGVRQIDITTLVEILNKLGLMEEKGDIISSKYVRNMVNLLKEYNHIAEHAIELKNMFQTIVDNSNDGIVYFDIEGNIRAVNEVLASQIGKGKENIIGKYVEHVLPELKNWKVEDVTRDIIKLYEKEVVAFKIPVKKEEKTIGYMITMEDANKIQNIEHELRRRMRKSEHNAIYGFEHIICKSDLMKKNIILAKKLALNNSTILIQGESGTGKELYAQAIHNYSERKMGPFVPVNFAALSVSLLESELFGYEEGAFTGAKKGGKMGLFEEAHGGTIFLDEIGDAPLDFQARLLRVLQEKQVRRVGSTKLIPIDVRVIAATNKDLKEEVEKGNFRQDLFYRLNVLPIYMPNLRDRKEDILLLIETYLNKFTNRKISNVQGFLFEEAIEYLFQYQWPGNIRELVNVIEYLVNIKNDHELIQINDLPVYVISGFKKNPNTLAVQLFDENTLWLLKKIKDSEGIGRKTLAILAQKEGIELSEGKIRGMMKNLENFDLIKMNKGVKGSVITQKGMNVLMG